MCVRCWAVYIILTVSRQLHKSHNSTDADGNVTVYKDRLVAKGFRKIQGVDYDETFSLVVKLKSVRIMLAIAAYYDYEIW